MNRFLAITIALFLITFKNVEAQVGPMRSGPQPSHINWCSIENHAVKVIFPDSNLKEAQRIADVIQHVNQKATVSIGAKHQKIDLLLNPSAAQANGYAALMPYHSQFYATGSQNFSYFSALDWLDNLAIHEYRHSLQLCNANRGNTKLFHLIAGEAGWAAGVSYSIPDWFLEGDAVLAETILSPAGRGRTPSFFEEQRALLLNGKNYSYMQARNGSFRNLIPSHYPLGYALVNYSRNQYGPELWSKVLADAGSYKSGKKKHFVYPFSNSLKHHTGISTPTLYKLAYADLKEQWEKELATLKLTPTEAMIHHRPKVVANYVFPHFLADGSIICLKNSYEETTKLIKIKDGVESALTSIGMATEPFLAFENNKATWTEIRKDGRRDAVEYSVVMSFDLASGLKKQLTRKSKYFSPAFSFDGNSLVVVDANEYIRNSLKILHAKTGSVIQTIPNEQNDFLSYPKWANQDSSIIYLAKRNSKVCMLKYDLTSKTTTELTDWSSHTIGAYTIHQDLVYFTSSFSGINNIYTVNINGDKQIRQMTSVRIGADMPAVSVDRQQLALIEQTEMGKQLSSLPVHQDALVSAPIQMLAPVDMERYRVLTTNVETNILDDIPQGNYQVQKYGGLLPGVKLHSWLPSFSFPSDANARDLGVISAVNDILGNFSANWVAKYNTNEGASHYGVGCTYSKYFLPISAEMSLGNRATNSLSADGKAIVLKTFSQVDVGLGLSLPLSWYRGNYFTGLKVHTFISHTTTGHDDFRGMGGSESLQFNSMKVNATFFNVRQRALQNTNTKWSQAVELGYNRSLNKAVSANRLTLKMNATTTGLWKNHGLQFGFKLVKEQNSNDYLYEDLFEHARGYGSVPRDLEYVVSVDYSFPLCYPDFGFGGALFFNRIRANLFYDMGRLQQNINHTVSSQNSTGAEIIIDMKFLNTIPLAIGFRNSFLLNQNPRNLGEKTSLSFFLTTPI